MFLACVKTTRKTRLQKRTAACLFFLSANISWTIVSTVSCTQNLYPGLISTWSLHHYWSLAKMLSSTALMTMEPGLHTGGSKAENSWPMRQGSCFLLIRSFWPSSGCWWQMMMSTTAQWRIRWEIWQVCQLDWLCTVSNTALVSYCNVNKG